MIAQHPILSAIPVDEHTQSPHFSRLPKVDLDKCVFFATRKNNFPRDTETRDIDLDELLSAQHDIPYEAPDPFWRLCILSHENHVTAAFFYHHALGDGQSGIAFHRTFHRALAHAISTKPDLAVLTAISPPATPLLPNLEAVHPLPVTLWHIIKILFREKVWSWRDPGLWTGGKCTVPPAKTRVRHLACSATTTLAFKDLCRANGTTITAALQTLIAGVLFSHLPNDYTSLKSAGALSMRRFLSSDAGITDDVMGVWIQDMSEIYARSSFPANSSTGKGLDVLPWPEAQRSRHTIEHALNLRGTNTAVGLLKFVNNFQEELFLPKIGKDRSSSFEVSNLGLFKPAKAANEDGNDVVKIGRMIFTQSAGVTSAAIQVSVVTGADGYLVLGVSWQEGIVEDELVEKVMDDVKAEIKSLTGTE